MIKERSIVRWLLACGVVGPPLFVAVFLVDGATRHGYNPWWQWVSHLSLGERGWLGTVNLLVFGLLMLGFSLGLGQRLRLGKGATWGPRLIATFGLGLLLAAVFPIDPSLDYPPGTPPATSPNGQVHDFAGALIFGSLTAVCLVMARGFAGDPRLWGWQLYSVVSGALVAIAFVACSVLVSLDYAGVAPGAPSGLFERISLIVGCTWIFLLALKLLREGEFGPQLVMDR